MLDQRKRCQVEMHDGGPCGRIVFPEYGGTKCICHTDQQNKDRQSFQAALYDILFDETAECYDLNQFIFPSDGWEFPHEINNELLCEKAVFQGYAIFWDCVFHQRTSFVKATFLDGASFYGARFMEATVFNGSRFSELPSFENARFKELANFEGTTFEKGVDFRQAKFKGTACFAAAEFGGSSKFSVATFEGKSSFFIAKVDGEMEFKGTSFLCGIDMKRAHLTEKARVLFDAEDFGGQLNVAFGGASDFRYMRLDRGYELVFRRVSLKRTRFFDTDLSQFRFVHVAWPIRERLPRHAVSWIEPLYDRWARRKFLERRAVYDELAVRTDPTKIVRDSSDPKTAIRDHCSMIAQLYRQLQANSIENYRYREAGDFYVGEQEMMRKTERNWVFGLPSYLYQGIAYYGQSYLLPLAWSLCVLVSVPLYLLYDGITLYDSQPPINYEWSWSFSDFLFLDPTYRAAFWANLSMATFNRSLVEKYLNEHYQRGIITLESVVLIMVISFLVLALRRAFKRKSF